MEGGLPPGMEGPPMHRHRSHDESFYVIEGTLTVSTPDGEHEIAAGDYVFVPRGCAHTFANRSDALVRFIGIGSGGLDTFLADLRAAGEDFAAIRPVLE